MADNVIQHSGTDAEHPARGVAGYHVEPQQFSFAVGDVGRGVLASLQENPDWAALRDSPSALRAAVSEQATRRPDKQFGDGFRKLYEWLADFHGILRFRSGDGVFRVVGLGDSRKGTGGFTAPLAGLQVTVTCGRYEPPVETGL
jgi:hypothetical protein